MAKKKTPITTALQDSIQEAVKDTVRSSIEAVSKEIGDYLDPHIGFANHKAYFCVQHLELHDLYKDISIDALFKTVITDSNDIDGDCDEENVANNIHDIEQLAKCLEANAARLRKHAARLKAINPSK